ncbi:ARM repeat-containing protein [Leucogyrophana mollusca]|uniref:ARM repeat-containing protein n=1 Tax=Leucogyrophana mollusca TaxID=85980 RepID=A0ACB8AXH8_9AGAM|nr:ARM repeat-containing protein [Leucogyrophana mollusca]
MTGILMQVKLRRNAGPVSKYAIDQKAVGLFAHTEDQDVLNPYITLVAELGVQLGMSAAAVTKARDRAKLEREDRATAMQTPRTHVIAQPSKTTPSKLHVPQQPQRISRAAKKHPRYSIFAYGCSNTVYRVINAGSRALYKDEKADEKEKREDGPSGNLNTTHAPAKSKTKHSWHAWCRPYSHSHSLHTPSAYTNSPDFLPSRNKALKKLPHFYWEHMQTFRSNAIRNDPQHPNECSRGATLRFLQKISKDAELLKLLIPICRSCLEHRHSYVTKNAVFAVYTTYRKYERLIPDAPELMQTVLAADSDATYKRNAFVFLAHCAMPKAVEWLISIYDQLTGLDELPQMSIAKVIRLDCKNDTTYRPRHMRCMSELLNSSSHAVKYEAAATLTTLTQNPATVKASCFVNLVVKESDNNVKLIVLDQLDSLRSKLVHVLDELTMDVLQVLSSADMEVRKKAMSIVLSMTSSRNVEEVALFLKKQL